MKKTTEPKPERLYEEPAKEYRIRCLQWILASEPEGVRIDVLTDRFRREFSEDACVKESIQRTLNIMHARDLVERYHDESDGRGVLWGPG